MVVSKKIESTTVRPAYTKKLYYIKRKGKNLDLMSVQRGGKKKKVERKLDAHVKKGMNYYAKKMTNGKLAVYGYRRKGASNQDK